MNAPRIVLLILFAACFTRARAQENPVPAPPAAPAQTEMQKWIAATDAQWQAAFKRDVTDVHEAELNKVKLLYLTSLEDGIKKASAANDLKGALALRNEQKRFGDTQVFPEKDEDSDAASVKAIRAAVRAQLARLEKDNAARAKALHAKYDAVLAQAQAQLTQHQRLDDAVLVQTKRDEVKASWLAGVPAAPAPAAMAAQPKLNVPAPVPKIAAAPAAESAGGNLLKNPNFENGTDEWVFSANHKIGTMAIDKTETHNGKPSLRIENPEGDDSFLRQTVTVKPNTSYRLAGYIKTKNVEAVKRGGKNGASFAVEGGFVRSPEIVKTKQWTRVSFDFATGKETQTKVGPRLGFYGGLAIGTAWFSKLTLTELGRAAKK